MENMLINASCEGKPIILMGDFNIDLLKESHAKNKWTGMYSTFELKQTIYIRANENNLPLQKSLLIMIFTFQTNYLNTVPVK